MAETIGLLAAPWVKLTVSWPLLSTVAVNVSSNAVLKPIWAATSKFVNTCVPWIATLNCRCPGPKPRDLRELQRHRIAARRQARERVRERPRIPPLRLIQHRIASPRDRRRRRPHVAAAIAAIRRPRLPRRIDIGRPARVHPHRTRGG